VCARALTLGSLLACARGAPAPPAAAKAETAAAPLAETPASAAETAALASAAPDATAAAPPACAELPSSFAEPVTFSRGVVTSPVPRVAGDPQSLRAFHDKLARIARGAPSEKVRIAFYGDSNMTRDVISGAFRRALQARFGDAGHGFVAAARPWGWYEHMDVRHDTATKEPWAVYAASGRSLPDRTYGFANIAAESAQRGASTWVATALASGTSPVGKSASSAEVFFLRRPGGGAFDVVVDGVTRAEVSTAAEAVEPGSARVTFPDGPHKVESVVRGGGAVRLFGTALERDGAGVVVDSLGAGALNYELLAHVDSPSRIAMLRERDYALVIFLLGTNTLNAERRWVSAVLADFKKALPGAALMLMSPPDQGVSHTDTSSSPAIARLSRAMKETSEADGVLFWDFYEAMGGKGAIRAFVRTGLGEPDGVHLGLAGAMLMGTRFASEIVRGFGSYVQATPDAGCASPAR
jgi:hypothetical protein